MADEGKTDERRGEEIDLNAEEEAALDRAWERMRRQEAQRKLQQSSTTTTAANDGQDEKQDEEEDGA